MPASNTYSGASLVLDTNVTIATEQQGGSVGEVHSDALALLRRCAELGITVWKSATTLVDVSHDGDASRRDELVAKLDRFPTLARVSPTPGLLSRAGYVADVSGNDLLDAELLAALDNHAINWLVTEDLRLARHADRAGLGERVLRCAEMVALLRADPIHAPTFPAVELRAGYEIPRDAPILETISRDYEGFQVWWDKVQAEHRDLLVMGLPNDPDALAVLKVESDSPHGLRGEVLKVCTFKVAERHVGQKLGEHLLKAVVEYARLRDLTVLYIEVLATHVPLLGWLEQFGFSLREGATTSRTGEVVLVKELVPAAALGSLAHAIAHGPGSVVFNCAYAVPIHPDWAQQLLPEAQSEVGLGVVLPSSACGNAIRKAYLCETQTRSMRAGDLLLFYQTAPDQLFTTCGILERVVVSADPVEILETIGARSVYSPEQVADMCKRGAVVALLFRFDRVLRPPLSLHEMIARGGLKSHPQSVTRINEGALTWLRFLLDV